MILDKGDEKCNHEQLLMKNYSEIYSQIQHILWIRWHVSGQSQFVLADSLTVCCDYFTVGSKSLSVLVKMFYVAYFSNLPNYLNYIIHIDLSEKIDLWNIYMNLLAFDLSLFLMPLCNPAAWTLSVCKTFHFSHHGGLKNVVSDPTAVEY